jgi:UDP-N-acetylmuramate--alanine ligase
MAKLRPRTESGTPSIPQRVHLVGAGGIHMSAIGQILLARGHEVTGSDLTPSEYTERLQALGGTVYTGHASANVGRAELVVTTAAAKSDNPELVEASRRGVTVISRAEMVQRLLAGRQVLAVAGTHGKTTTSSLVALMAVRGGLDPLALLGGDARELGGNARDGAGAFAVLEADEYAEAFLQYTPHIALVTNIEADHLDYYGTEERYFEAFDRFSQRVTPDGTLIVCADSPRALALGNARRAAGARVERYAVTSPASVPAEWRATNLRLNDAGAYDFTATLEGNDLGRLSLRVPGRHNVANALGALAVAMRAGVDFHRAALAAAEFTGARRRFDLLGEAAGVTIVDDYSHHPTEVKVMVSAARQRYAGRRLVAVFQPHTYSRSVYLLEGFKHCFEGLDALYVLRTYAAREEPEAGLDARGLAEQIEAPRAVYLDSFEEAEERMAADLQPGDVLFTVGAGTITELGPRVLARLEATR